MSRPRAISEYLLDRMLRAGTERVAIVISGEKTDLVRYYAESAYAERVFFVLQPRPLGLCDAVFRALPHLGRQEEVLIGLPDTLWFPEEAGAGAARGCVQLITFPVEEPEQFDAVIADAEGRVRRIEVKQAGPQERRIWGAMRMPASELRGLWRLWLRRERRDEYLGHLLNAWIEAGHAVVAEAAGREYLDVGTLEGYRKAVARLEAEAPEGEWKVEAGGAESRKVPA